MSTMFTKLDLLTKFQSIWTSPWGQPKPIKEALPSPWDSMTYANFITDWEQEDTDILFECEQRKTFCHARLKSSDTRGQTLLLGFDLQANQILLDEFFPASDLNKLQQSFDVVLTSQSGILVLSTEVLQRVYLHSRTALLLTIVSKKRVKDRRLNPRIHVKRNTSPKVELLIPLVGTIKGNLLDLSTEGLTMMVFGVSTGASVMNTGECCLFLSERVKFKTKMKVKQISHNRRQTKYTCLRVLFCQTSDEQVDQLNAFIQSFLGFEYQAA